MSPCQGPPSPLRASRLGGVGVRFPLVAVARRWHRGERETATQARAPTGGAGSRGSGPRRRAAVRGRGVEGCAFRRRVLYRGDLDGDLLPTVVPGDHAETR